MTRFEDDLRTEFDAESRTLLSRVEGFLQRPNDDGRDAALRAMHTLAGTGGYFGLSEVVRIAKAVETGLARRREAGREIAGDDVAQVREAVRRLKSLLSGSADGSDATAERMERWAREEGEDR